MHGARSVIYYAKDKDDSLSQWINKLSDRRHANVATVALAAKTARMAWALVNNDTDYNETLAAGYKKFIGGIFNQHIVLTNRRYKPNNRLQSNSEMA